jgi:2'-5' RNA ligase
MRVFISLEIPDNIREEILRMQKILPKFSGKITEPENLHLTLKFLGEISEQEVEKVKSKLKEIKLKKFESELVNLGVFDKNYIRIIWVYLDNCNKLQEEIDLKLENLFPKEKRFMSHLTIARVKQVKDRKKFLQELNKIKIKNIKFSISSFFLKKSILTKEKPVYETIEEYNLI